MTVWINEFHYDNTGADTGEFIEIAGPVDTDLLGWSIVLYNGNGGGTYGSTIDLSSAVLTGEVNGIGFWSVAVPGLQNGAPDGFALVDGTGAVIEFLSYEGSFTAVGGPADGLTSTDINVSEPNDTPIGFSLQRVGEGRVASDFTWAAPAAETPMAVNDGQTIAAEDDNGGGGGGPTSGVYTLEILHIADQEAGAAAVIDAPNLSAVMNALEAQDLGGDGLPDNTIRLSSGDAFIPGVFYDASTAVYGQGGVADILIQNELGLQAIALGNHEFDFGTAELATLISGDGVAGFDGTLFPYVSGNLDFSTDANLAPLAVADGGAPLGATVTGSVVLDENGEQIGVIGATTPTLASISSAGGVGISPTPFGATPSAAELDALAAVIQADVDALLAANPDMNKVILLAHMQQLNIELELAERLSGVDVIVAGGSNTRLFDDNDIPRAGDSDQGQYPQFVTDADGNTTAVVNTDGGYKYVGRLVIDFDENGNIVPGSYDETVSGAYATDAAGVARLGAEALVDPEIQAIADAIEAQVIETEGNVFGVSSEFLNGNRSGGPLDGVRTQETNLGNLTADANLAYAQQSDADVMISIKNGGGIRASIGETVVPAGGTEAVRLPNGEIVDGEGNVVKPEGGISQNDIQTTLAFNNGLTLLTLTAAEIVALLEHGVSAVPGVSGRFAQISGVEFTYDPDLPAGDRILNAEIVDENGVGLVRLVEDGEIVTPDAEYRVVTLDFLTAPRFDASGAFIGGGDGYPFPNTNTDPSVGEVGDAAVIARVNAVALEEVGVATGDATFANNGTEQDALAEYLLENFNPNDGDAPFSEADVAGAFDERILSVDDYTPIYDIQGAALVSPLVGQAVTTRGIVTAVDSNGFYLQDEYGDGDDATSDALFVFTGGAPGVTAGDEVAVSGTVSEFTPGGASTGNQSTTQISSVTSIFTVETGQTLPEAVSIGEGGHTIPTESIDDDPSNYDPAADGLDFFESIEGMRVSVDNLQVVAGTNRFGEVFGVSGDATGLSDRGTLNISPDDFNPERIQFNFDSGIFDPGDPLVDVGDTITNVTGVVSYSFGNYEILPTEALGDIIDGGLEAETTEIEATDTQLTIASYNVLNLDPNDADGDMDVANGRFEAVARQILENMGTPDIVGLQEIQDNTGSVDDGVVSADETLARLIEALDRVDDGVVNGSTPYAFIDNTFIDNNASGGQPGANIRTAFLYNTDRVDLVDGSVGTIGTQGPGGSFDGARLPLKATFEFNGEDVTVINNHFSSKGGSQPIFGTTQPFEQLQNELNPDGTPVVNGSLDERLAQATAVSLAVEEMLTDDPNAKIAVVGDFNEFEFVRPLEILEEAGLTNLTNSLPEDERYSFIFQGNSQSLDHILVSDALRPDAQFDAVHVNTEFAETPERASDHDPLVAGLTILPSAPEVQTVSVEFNESGFFFFRKTVADTTIGEQTFRENIGLLSKEEHLDFAGVTLSSEGPGLDLIVALGGSIGISSRGERLSDRTEINNDEFLFLDLGGDANRFTADFEERRGKVELAFFDDGALVSTADYRLSKGMVEVDTGFVFDTVRISDGGRKGLELEGFAFDRLIDDEDGFVFVGGSTLDDGYFL